MSEVLAQLEKKGGNLSETLLYQNTSPVAVNDGTITLSQSYRNFDFIKIVYARNMLDLSNTTEVYVPTDAFSALGVPGQVSTNRLILGSALANGDGGGRYVYPTSDTIISFSNWYRLNAANSNSNGSIIMEIYGVK